MSELATPEQKNLAPAAQIFAPEFITAKSGARLRVAKFPAADDGDRVCVLLNGQTEFIEKYFEVIDELRARRFLVVTMDWRGQGGSVRALTNPRKVHIESFVAYDDDLASLLDQVVSALSKRPPIGLAHSMGGHNLLRTMYAGPNAFSRAVLSAPMIAVSTRGTPSWLARTVAASMTLASRQEDWVWGMDQRDPINMSFDDQLVTSDPARFKRTQEILAKTPEIRLSGPTWGWLDAAYRSMRAMHRPGYAEAIATPTLFVLAGRDRICLTPDAQRFASRMPNAKAIDIEDAEHEILMENDSIRARFWKAFDDFVRE
jgi:lysophospholipase